MTVKILLDPILTAAPSRCSTFIQMATLMERWKDREDVFFYCLLADWDHDQEDLDWLPRGDRIRYIPVPQHKDRTREYITFRDELLHMVAFNGELWDWDVLLTVRSGMAQLYRLHASSPRISAKLAAKQIWVVENMPLMDFKESVLTIDADVQDRFTMSGYLAADRVTMMSYHEKDGVLASARKLLPPSAVRALDAKIKEVIPAQFDTFELKSADARFRPGGERPFGIAYVGRLAATGTNLDKIYDVMTKQWIIRGGSKVRMLVSTVSKGGPKKSRPPEHIERVHAPREEFWRMAREDMDCIVIMHSEAGFLLSMMEPIMLGTPVIVIDKPWARGQLGPDYPFYVKNEKEAYAWAQALYDDYDAVYAQFETWHRDWFEPTYKKRFEEDLLYTVLEGYLDEYLAHGLDEVRGRTSMKSNSVVQALAEHGGDTFSIPETLKRLSDEGVIGSLADKLKDGDMEKRGLVWATAWNDFRNGLKAHHGFRDAGLELGLVTRTGAPDVGYREDEEDRPQGH